MPEARDFVVVGAGPGGYTAALAAAARGRQVTLVDAAGPDGVGGVCLLSGCIPSKALIRLADAAHRTGRDAEMGLLREGGHAVDLARFQSWKGGLVTTLGNGVRSSLRSAGVDVIAGRASFVDDTTIRVERGDEASQIIQFDDLVLATGSAPVAVPGFPWEDGRVLDAAGVLALDAVPGATVVVGAGYIGVELGTALAKLGSAVTLVEAQAQILPGIGERASRVVAKRLRDLGVTVHVGAAARGATDRGALIAVDGTDIDVSADVVVVAVGRRPATEALHLERAGIEMDGRGCIVVAGDLRCHRHIAAIGDVVAGPGLAHKAMSEARIAVAALCGDTVAFDHVVPCVVFSDPEVAYVGLTLDRARQTYPDAREVTVPIARAGRSLVEQNPAGFASLVFDNPSGQVLGAVLCGAHATELISEVALAIEARLAVDDLALTIHPHPTISEIVCEAALAAGAPERK